MIIINLLPRKGLFPKTVLIISLSLLLMGLLMQLILIIENQRLEQKLTLLRESNQEDEKDMSSTIWALGSEKNELSQLPKKIENLKKELTSLLNQVTLLERDRSADRWINALPLIAANLPKTIWFTRVETSQAKTLLLEGKGIDYNEILHWIDTMQQQNPPHRSHVRYLQMQQVIQFGIEVWMDGETL